MKTAPIRKTLNGESDRQQQAEERHCESKKRGQAQRCNGARRGHLKKQANGFPERVMAPTCGSFVMLHLHRSDVVGHGENQAVDINRRTIVFYELIADGSRETFERSPLGLPSNNVAR